MNGNGSRKLAIVGGTVITRDRAIEDGAVLVEDGRITFVGRARDAGPESASEIIDAGGLMVLPGLIDTHVHGSHGDDVMFSDAEGIRRISRAQARYGTTAYLPSTVSAHHEHLLRALEACAAAVDASEPAAEIVGIHVEGPFINRNKKGAHSLETLRDPDLDQCMEYLRAAPGLLKIMTLAPELPGAMELIRLLVAHDVVPSLGHSEADYDTALEAMEAGATHATHLYNAMPALHHRKPSLTTACLNEPFIRAEIVLDGLHVAPEMARLAARNKGREGLIIVTDALAAVGCPDGTYTLGDLPVKVEGDRCVLMDGETIASSMLTMNRAVGNAVAFTGASLVDAAYMASFLPAQICGVSDRKGSLEVGKDADIAVLAQDYSARLTVCKGEVAYKAMRNDER
ncbi:MAG TPA: N-acetylglucosamine-6-phosphate deacetylase [Pyrinomonadaceae bacterium]|nr:N-acetylglucosamine-6-phosphate deacetylase [Pyrinomonadaceae bacterium]